MREITIGSNYITQNPVVQVFGEGSATIVDELRVEWPAIDSGSGPMRPPDTVQLAVAAGGAGETLTIAHPELP